MNRLYEIRKQLNISQIEAAKLLNVSRRTYQKYESLDNLEDEKYNYLVYKFEKYVLVDETHGILSVNDIKKIASIIFDKYDIKSCYLFGSYAKGVATERSDVDLLIDSHITGLDFYGLIDELRIGLKKQVDLISIYQLNNNSELLSNVLKEGIKIYG